jgi:Rieske Fe-S protein
MNHERDADKVFDTTRREFCGSACQALALAAIGSTVPGCGGGGGSPTSSSGSGGSAPQLQALSGTAASGSVAVAITTGSPLASVGSAALVQSGSGSFLVARTGPEAFSALTATCTHEACTVSGFENARFVCPCHGSSFDTGGRVLTGPAVSALRSFQTRFANNVLTITL